MAPEGFNLVWPLIAAVIGTFGILIAAMLGSLSALWLRMGSVQRELGGVQGSIVVLEAAMRTENAQLRRDMEIGNNQLREETAQLRRDMKIGNNQLREETAQLRRDMKIGNSQLRQDMERGHNQLLEEMVQLRQDMERNHNQLMRAILAHSHRDDGRPTFDLPPDFEPTPADN